MKKRLLTAICLFITSIASLLAGEPTIKFESEKHDFGNIKEANGLVTATFTFKNTGDGPLVITSAKSTCGCTNPKYSQKPIKPGETSEISVTYNPVGRPGEFFKEVTVKTNDKNHKRLKLIIKGNVIPSTSK
ncbi:MAG: DUF1573 domain-containing protein [Muribaculaceae bacterium]|nr:DUF1573 domain-containing protein [Muribaculaceae bacterium]MDE5856806.1 DUF1573 domain-containing protein [Muribaculaceae bacterium]